jgi:hypothetical protein
LINQNNTAADSGFILDIANLKLYGEIMANSYEDHFLAVVCEDYLGQVQFINFVLTVIPNRAPTQQITDLTPYKIIVGEGMTFDYVLPVGIYTDLDGDTIIYDACFFQDYSSLETSWSTYVSGEEGNAKIAFTDAEQTLKTGVSCFYSDGYGANGGPFTIPLESNLRPIPSTSLIEHSVYPNDTFTWEVDLGSFFADPESDTLSFTFSGMPASITSTLVSGSTYRFESDISLVFTGGSVQETFQITADDGYSLPDSINVNLNLDD